MLASIAKLGVHLNLLPHVEGVSLGATLSRLGGEYFSNNETLFPTLFNSSYFCSVISYLDSLALVKAFSRWTVAKIDVSATGWMLETLILPSC